MRDEQKTIWEVRQCIAMRLFLLEMEQGMRLLADAPYGVGGMEEIRDKDARHTATESFRIADAFLEVSEEMKNGD